MAAEQLQRQEASAIAQHAQESRRSAHRRAEDTSELDNFLPYGSDPIPRLDELEAQVAGITRKIKEDGANGHDYAGPDDEAQWEGTTSLRARVEALENRAGGYSQGDQTPSSAGNSTGTSRPDDSSTHRDRDEVEQLRFHVATLASQLARAEAVLKEVQGTRVRRWRRSGHSRPIWMFWRRRTRG